MGKRKWTVEEKLELMKECERFSVLRVARERGVSSATLYNWKKKYDAYGPAGFKKDAKSQSSDRLLSKENQRLKNLLIEKELELEAQREMLKKKFGTSDIRKI